jgi:hypothetical protein
VPTTDISDEEGAAGPRYAGRFTRAGGYEGPRLGQQVLDLHRELPYANARRVVHRRRNGGREAGEADLADAARSRAR